MGPTAAGPTLKGLIAAELGRMLLQKGTLFDAEVDDPNRSGVYREEWGRVVLTRTNRLEVVDAWVESSLTWEVVHPLWTLRLKERRRLDGDGGFEKSAPYQVSLEGDPVEAGRFLRLPRELFFNAVRADGWSPADVTVHKLRWLDGPLPPDDDGRNVVLRLL